MTQKNHYIIAYDIVSDKKRRRTSELLKDYGIRMQKSVFECILDTRTLEELICKLDDTIDPKEDSVLIYPLCRACVKQYRYLGLKPIRIDTEFDIL